MLTKTKFDASHLVMSDTSAGIFRIHRDAYKSPEVFALEKEKIFSK